MIEQVKNNLIKPNKLKSESISKDIYSKPKIEVIEQKDNFNQNFLKQKHNHISTRNEGVGGIENKLNCNPEKDSIELNERIGKIERSSAFIFKEKESEEFFGENWKESIFKQFLTSQPIFKKDRDKLRPSYVPDNLPHREKEINQLASILVTAMKGGRPSNVFIYGKTGTGKTAVVKFLEKEMLKLSTHVKIQNRKLDIEKNKFDKSEKIDFNVCIDTVAEKKENDKKSNIFKIKPIYINCKIVDTQYGVLANIGNRFIEKFNERIPFTGWPTEKVYGELKSRIIENGGVITIILDEVDKLVTKSGDEVLYLLSRINNELEESGNGKAKVSLIGISNYLNFMDLLDSRVKSSLGEEEIIFHPYNATQLENILQQRAELAFEEGALAPGVIQMCASFAAQEHGDARKALELLRIAGELAEREKSPKVLEKHVRMAQYKIELNRVNEVVRTLPTHSKIVLLGIILSEERGNRKLMTGEVYDIYKELCRRANLSNLTQRRVADLISELDMLGIINALLISKGRYGRTREIQLSVPLQETKKVLEEDELLKSISTHKLRIQTRLE